MSAMLSSVPAGFCGFRIIGTRAAVSALLLLVTSLALVSCGVGPGPGLGPGGGPRSAVRQDSIAREPLGDYYVGRRFHLKGTRLWGYLRKPRESWKKARLVVMNESERQQPDRLPELNLRGPSHGFDHNYEYHLRGRFSGEEVYDPNSNLFVSEFVLTGYTEVSRGGGYLIRPGDMNNQRRLPQLW